MALTLLRKHQKYTGNGVICIISSFTVIWQPISICKIPQHCNLELFEFSRALICIFIFVGVRSGVDRPEKLMVIKRFFGFSDYLNDFNLNSGWISWGKENF